MNILCRLGIHNYKIASEPTRAYGLKGEYIYKIKVICSKCGDSKLKVERRVA
jgi:hypothetical protein